MTSPNLLSLVLGLIIFSFLVTSLLVVPFINFLYKMHLTRKKEAPKKGTVPLFDKLHDKKAGTPVGGGILLIVIISILFAVIFSFASKMGVFIECSFNLKYELFIVFFTFISFGLIGLSDDLVKIFGKPKAGLKGLLFGLGRWQKFALQWFFAFLIGYVIYKYLGIQILHIPFVSKTLYLGPLYIPFAAFTIVSFTNAFNITDGLDGLASGLLLICLTVFGVILAGRLDTPLSLFIAIWIGSLIAFLYFNVWPARIFLGDSGALSFGATLAVIGLLSGSIIALVVVGGIFVIEILSSAVQMFGWKFFKKAIFPLAPIHHTFLAIGWEESKIVFRAWLAGIILAIFGLWLSAI